MGRGDLRRSMPVEHSAKPSEESRPRRSGWRGDYFAACEISQFWGWPVLVIVFVLTGWLLSPLGIAKSRHQVVVYTSQDQVYAAPIFREFERATGVKVRAVFDSEAVKTVGLANRLLAEKDHPQCDVFWNNEVFRTHQLEAKGVFRDQDPFVEVGYRSRRIVINTNKLALADAPRSLLELTNGVWRGKVALAYPLFGTTCTHFLALRHHWDTATWGRWCRALQANAALLVDGNSVVVRVVGQGQATIGLTDSDDISAGQTGGYPIAALPIDDETLLIPNTLAVVRGCPHPDAAQKLVAYLQQPEVLKGLVAANALEGVAPHQVPARTLRPDWDALVRDLEPATRELREIFLR
jgi:iron(III) transport system substrate-binding protein